MRLNAKTKLNVCSSPLQCSFTTLFQCWIEDFLKSTCFFFSSKNHNLLSPLCVVKSEIDIAMCFFFNSPLFQGMCFNKLPKHQMHFLQSVSLFDASIYLPLSGQLIVCVPLLMFKVRGYIFESITFEAALFLLRNAGSALKLSFSVVFASTP